MSYINIGYPGCSIVYPTNVLIYPIIITDCFLNLKEKLDNRPHIVMNRTNKLDIRLKTTVCLKRKSFEYRLNKPIESTEKNTLNILGIKAQ